MLSFVEVRSRAMTRPTWVRGQATPEERRPVGMPPPLVPPPGNPPAEAPAPAPAPASPPRPPSKAEAAALAEPVARMRQALALLDGADLAAAPPYAFGTVRRRRNQVGHCLDQARAALRRALELARRG